MNKYLILLLSKLLILVLCNCSPTKPLPKNIDSLLVSVQEQKIHVVKDENVVKSYPISTSKYGLGNKVGSNKTPLGKHKVVEKIGEGLELGAVLKARKPTGEVIPQDEKTPATKITTRIIRIKGEESKNSNTYKRNVYIHGTTRESDLGKPASIGCVRMADEDIVEIFPKVDQNTKINIIEEKVTKNLLASNKNSKNNKATIQ